jgi:hypothetical protein
VPARRDLGEQQAVERLRPRKRLVRDGPEPFARSGSSRFELEVLHSRGAPLDRASSGLRRGRRRCAGSRRASRPAAPGATEKAVGAASARPSGPRCRVTVPYANILSRGTEAAAGGALEGARCPSRISNECLPSSGRAGSWLRRRGDPPAREDRLDGFRVRGTARSAGPREAEREALRRSVAALFQERHGHCTHLIAWSSGGDVGPGRPSADPELLGSRHLCRQCLDQRTLHEQLPRSESVRQPVQQKHHPRTINPKCSVHALSAFRRRVRRVQFARPDLRQREHQPWQCASLDRRESRRRGGAAAGARTRRRAPASPASAIAAPKPLGNLARPKSRRPNVARASPGDFRCGSP